MREKIIYSFLFALLFNSVQAQRSLTPGEIVPKTDDALSRIFYAAEKKDITTVNNIIAELNNIIQPYAKEYPEFTGIMELHLGYYATESTERKRWINKGIDHIKNSDSTLAENFSGNFLWLIQSFEWDKRMDEWKGIDSIFRLTINKGKDSMQYNHAVLNYGNIALAEKKYSLVSNLAKYELVYLKHLASNKSWFKVNKAFAGWLELAQRFEQWKTLSYSKQTGNKYFMNEGQVIPDFLQQENEDSLLVNYDYNGSFRKLTEEVTALQKEYITQNHRSDSSYDAAKRSNYFFLLNTILSGYSNWSILSQNESKPLLPLKLFIWEDINDEMQDSKKHQAKPLIPADMVVNAYNSLSILYNAVGNSELASDVLNEGLGQIIRHPSLSQDEKLKAVGFYPQFVAAYRSAGNFEKANEGNEKWIALVNKPASPITTENVQDFDRYYNPKIEQVFTLLAMGKNQEATDKTIEIIDSIAGLVLKNEDIIYGTRSWVKLQYLTSIISGQNNKWNPQLVKEMVSDLMQGRIDMPILYPAHLLMLKAGWKETKKINQEYLTNLLRYTGKQLFENFSLLNAQERMQYFSMRLQEYFDVYHELLFTNALNEYPILKQKVLDQSLYLKNSLSDGNLIPDDFFADYAKRNPDYLTKLRKLRQHVILVNDKRKLFNKNTDAMMLNDQFQQLWLSALNNNAVTNTSKNSLQELINTQLTQQSVYIETVRYRQWLTDSSFAYGAYIFEKNKPVKIILLCTEKNLSSILNNPAASPQNAAVAANISRGTEVLGKKTTDKKKYSLGDKDLLAELLLTPLAPYIHKKEWIISNDGLLNRISFAALYYNKKFLTELVQVRQISSSTHIKNEQNNTPGKKILLAGDINYGQSNTANNKAFFKPSVQWKHLPGTKSEVANLKKIMEKAGYQTSLLSGNNLPDSLYAHMGEYNIIHLATHGFYYKSEEAKQYINEIFSTEAIAKEPLFRCGLAVSNANSPGDEDNESTPGYILGYELANTDLRNCYLIALSACETGLGDLRNNMGVDGLSRALKIGGAKNLLISLWKVPDEPTAMFMQYFYEQLFSTGNPAVALRNTQLKMCKQYQATEWAAFILVE